MAQPVQLQHIWTLWSCSTDMKLLIENLATKAGEQELQPSMSGKRTCSRSTMAWPTSVARPDLCINCSPKSMGCLRSVVLTMALRTAMISSTSGTLPCSARHFQNQLSLVFLVAEREKTAAMTCPEGLSRLASCILVIALVNRWWNKHGGRIKDLSIHR